MRGFEIKKLAACTPSWNDLLLTFRLLIKALKFLRKGTSFAQ